MGDNSEPGIDSGLSGSLADDQNEMEEDLDDVASGEGPIETVEDLCNLTLESSVNNGDDNSEGENPKGENVIVTPRTYQLEMLEESLKGNVIVAVSLGCNAG